MREVGLRRGGPEPGVDADEEQTQAWADQVGDLGVAERLQLGPVKRGTPFTLSRRAQRSVVPP
jgi:hypothetical protein